MATKTKSLRSHLFSPRRCLLLALPLFLTLAAGTAWGQADNLRIQHVVKNFVAETGHVIAGSGSWISGVGYAAGKSDHDLRLLMPQGTSSAQARGAWREARDGLVRAIRREFGDRADEILRKTNLYPPSQLMTAVEDAADASRVFVRAQQVPGLGHSGSVTPKTEFRFVEGLYGDGSQAFAQFYEQNKGRLFYKSGNVCVAGATDLAHFEEGRALFTVSGTAHTAQQWGDHALEALAEGDARVVNKQLARLERDLAKSRQLAGMTTNTSLRGELQEVQRLLNAAPERARELTGRIRNLVARAQSEAGMLKVFGSSGPLRQGIVRILMDSVSAGNDLSKLLQKAYAPVSRLCTFENLCKVVVAYFAVKQISRAFADSWLATAKEAAAFYTLLPTGTLILITDSILEQAKENGYILVAGSQEAWDLMAGVYSAWGRAGVDPDPRRRFTLDDLVNNYQTEAPLKTLIFSQSLRASCRNLGGIGDDIDRSVADAIYEKCMPVILQAWNWQRDELFGEYTELARAIQHSPLLIFYAPAPASTANGPVTITATARSLAPQLSEQLDRMDKIIKLLCGKRAAVPVDYEWTPTGSGDAERTSIRKFTFTQPGIYPVKAHLRVWPVAPGIELSNRLLIRRDVWGEADIEVTGKASGGFWVLDRVEIRKRFNSHAGNGLLNNPSSGVSHTYTYQTQTGETGAQATLAVTLTQPKDYGSGDEMQARSEKWSRTAKFSWNPPPRALEDGQNISYDLSVTRENCTYEASIMTRPQRYLRDAIKQPNGKLSLTVQCVVPYKGMSSWAAFNSPGGTDDKAGPISVRGNLPKLPTGCDTLEILFQLDDADAKGYMGIGVPNEAVVVYIYKRGNAAK